MECRGDECCGIWDSCRGCCSGSSFLRCSIVGWPDEVRPHTSGANTHGLRHSRHVAADVCAGLLASGRAGI